MLKAILIFLALFLIMGIWHPHPYNTERVCFSKDGKVAFYAQGFSPNTADDPITELTKGVYKIKATGEKLEGSCKWSWGVNKPKGREYYE